MARILLVDDDLFYLTGTEELLRRYGDHQVTTAQDLGQALSEVRASRYDVVITDKNLGGSRGVLPLLEFLKDERPETKVVLNTAEPHSSRLKEELCFSRFHYKPDCRLPEVISRLVA